MYDLLNFIILQNMKDKKFIEVDGLRVEINPDYNEPLPNGIKDEYGNTYRTKQEYYNSPWLDPDIIYNYLAQGKRQPQNEQEEKLAIEGKELIKKGYEIPFN